MMTTKISMPDFKTNKLFYVSAVMLLLALVLLGLALRAEYRTALARPVPSRAPFTLGQEVTTGAVTMKLSDPSYEDGTGMFAAPEGKHYLIMNLSVKNNSNKTINVLPASDTYVKTADGKVAYLTPYMLQNPLRAGELLAGETISGQVSYLVPRDTAVKFYADSIWSGSVVPIATK